MQHELKIRENLYFVLTKCPRWTLPRSNIPLREHVLHISDMDFCLSCTAFDSVVLMKAKVLITGQVPRKMQDSLTGYKVVLLLYSILVMIRFTRSSYYLITHTYLIKTLWLPVQPESSCIGFVNLEKASRECSLLSSRELVLTAKSDFIPFDAFCGNILACQILFASTEWL